MTSKTNSSRLTPANVIAIIAMALLSLFTFFGQLYSSDNGMIGTALLLTIFEITLLTAALVLSIKAKAANSHFGMWRIVKYTALVVYVVVAICFARPVLKYFYVASDKVRLQEMALTEIRDIDSLYIDYHSTMKTKTNIAVQLMKDYVASVNLGASKSSSMEEYLNDMHIDRSDIDSWGAKITKVWRIKNDSSLAEMRDKINSWGPFDMHIAQVGASIENRAVQVENMLNNKVKENINEHRIIPIFSVKNNRYNHDGYVDQAFHCSSTGGFHKALSKVHASTTTGWIMLVLLHLLILLNFFVAESSSVIGPGQRRNKDGQVGSNGISL